jgi:hypothetical protein
MRPKCTCCNDTGKVITATGIVRPCSRCRTELYLEWAKTYFVPQSQRPKC